MSERHTQAPEGDDWLVQLIRTPAGTVLTAGVTAASQPAAESEAARGRAAETESEPAETHLAETPRAAAPTAAAPNVGVAEPLGQHAPIRTMPRDEGAREPARTGESVLEVAISAIHPNPDQPRRTFDADELAALAASITAQGVIQPVVVRPSADEPGQFQLVVGERRWRAAKLAGLTAIPAIVRRLGDERTAEIALVENIQRADLPPLEEARAYAQLIDRHGHTQDDLARRLGRNRSHVAHMLRLLRLPAAVQEMIAGGAISVGHARVLVNVADPQALADRIVAEGLSVRQTEAAAKTGRADAAPAAAVDSVLATPVPDREAWANRFRTALDRPVTVKTGRGGGSIVIRYHTEDDLAAILARMGG